MRIDAHQHFWMLSRGDYGWLTSDLSAIYRDFIPEDLEPLLRASGIDGTVLVQAAPSVAETEFLLQFAENYSFILGVVGWVDFENPNSVSTIDHFLQHKSFVGLRPVIQDIADPNWMLRADLDPVFAAMIERDLTFDALTLPHHLKNLQKLLGRYPDLRVVIDHGSKPVIREQAIDDWAQDMATLASETSAFCKLSGLVTEANPDWSIDDLRPYVDHLLETFGPGRLLWGSDWPVCTLASTYERWVAATEVLLAGLSEADQSAILGGNAIRAYRLES